DAATIANICAGTSKSTPNLSPRQRFRAWLGTVNSTRNARKKLCRSLGSALKKLIRLGLRFGRLRVGYRTALQRRQGFAIRRLFGICRRRVVRRRLSFSGLRIRYGTPLELRPVVCPSRIWGNSPIILSSPENRLV